MRSKEIDDFETENGPDATAPTSVGAMARRLALVVALVSGSWAILVGAGVVLYSAARVAARIVGAVLP